MHKNTMKCNKTQSKWCINKDRASKIIDMFETNHPPQGPMTRARAKAIHDKVNLLLNTLDLEHTLDGSLPHCNIICAVQYEPHGATTKDEEHEEEAWKRRKKKSAQEMNRLNPAPAPAIAGHRLKPASTPAIAGHTV
jgi:hypothetical protein